MIMVQPITFSAVLFDMDGLMFDTERLMLRAWRRAMAEQGVDDLSAIMEPGLSALLAVRARGGDASAPAMTLWEEFLAARDALLALAPPQGGNGPRRST